MMKHTDVIVHVQTNYLPAQSDPDREQFVFAYTITLTNRGEEAVQLLNRAWTITDANGDISEVHGDGVVGQQPIIEAGASFSYTSGAVLKTPVGTMEGYYGMKTLTEQALQVAIPRFRLALPHILH